MNIGSNKIYVPLGARRAPALYYSLAALEKNGYVDEIVLVVRREDKDLVQEAILHDKFPKKPVWVALGGKTRSDSVQNALEKVTGGIVLVHDGARPLLRQQYITSCVEAMDDSPGAIVAVEAAGTVRTVDENGYIIGEAERGKLYQAQTPQCFHTDILRECYRRLSDTSAVTDDSALLAQCGYAVRILPGDISNVKLTVPLDVKLAEYYLASHDETGKFPV